MNMKKILLVFFLPISLYSQPFTKNPLAYFSFDKTTNDVSGNGFIGNGSNIEYVADRTGKDSMAAYFNGSSSEVITNFNVKNLREYTVSAWIKIPASGGGIIINQRGYTGRGDGITLGTNFLGLDGDNAQRGLLYNYPFTPDTWYHIVGVWRGIYGSNIEPPQFELYINGNRYLTVNEFSAGNTRVYPLNADSNLMIGHHYAWNQWFNGAVDELMIFDKALCPYEIDFLYKDIAVVEPYPEPYIISKSKYTIKWLKKDSINSVNISYTTDNGNTWISIASNISGNSYEWLVPSIKTDSLIIKIENSSNTSNYDQTNYLSIVNKDIDYGLLLYYPLSSNVDDASGNGNHGSAYNVTNTPDISGFPNSSMFFDSNNDSITINRNDLKTGPEGTISMWIKAQNYANSVENNIIINRRDAGIRQFYLNLHNNNNVGLHFRYGTGNEPNNKYICYKNSRLWEANSWHHVAIQWKRVYGTTFLYLFADGLLVSETTTPLLINEPANWLIGAANDGKHAFRGAIDEVRIYQKAISADLMKKVYYNGLPMHITTPSAGTDLLKNTQQELRWVVPYGIEKINIDFSSDNAKTWTTIFSEIPADSSFVVWNVPDITSNSCFFRLYKSQSDIYFTQKKKFRIVAESSQLSLVYYYKLNGNEKDSSGNNYNATIYNAIPASGIDFFENGAYMFDGTSSYIEVPSDATSDLNAFTFSCWIKTNENTVNTNYLNLPHIFGGTTNENPNRGFGITTCNGYIGIWSGLNSNLANLSFISNTFVGDNKWHNITCTYNESLIKLYVDGEIIDYLPANLSLNKYGYWIMAQRSANGSPALFHKGIIDEIRFYKKAIDSELIKQLIESTQPLEIITPLDNSDHIKGSAINISWIAPSWIKKIDINYSQDNGANWINIASEINAENKTYKWNIPNIVKDSVIIKVTGKESNNSGTFVSLMTAINIVENKLYQNLEAWYPFDVNADDFSRNKHNGSVYGPVLINYGYNNNGQSYSFDGLDDYIVIPDFTPLQEYSITFWYKTSTTRGALLSLWGEGYIAINDIEDNYPGKLCIILKERLLTDTLHTNDNNWHLVVITVDESKIKLYVDNRFIGEAEKERFFEYNEDKLYLGQYNSKFRYKGEIDDLRVYKKVIDLPTMDALYQINVPPSFVNNFSSEYILVYPNPFKNHVYVTTDRNIKFIQIFNSTGKIMYSEKFNGKNQIAISLPDLPNGLYFIVLIDVDNNRMVRKIFKN
jgi:hypothetical protein